MASSASKREDRVLAQKVLTLDAYPGLPLDDVEFVLENITTNRGRGLKQHTALFLAKHPQVAQAIDRMSWQEQAKQQMLWLPAIKRELPKAMLIAQSGLLELFELTEYHEDSPEVQRVKQFAITFQPDIKRIFGLWCAEDHSAIQIVNKLAKALGHPAQLLRRVGPRGAQVKIWGWSDVADEDRAVIHAALEQKWAELLPPPVTSISDKRNSSSLTGVKATTPETPADTWIGSGRLSGLGEFEGPDSSIERLERGPESNFAPDSDRLERAF